MTHKEKLKIPYPVIVEGRYDKIRLSGIIEAQIIPTDGFGLFKKQETRILLRRLAEASPLIVLTDSDGGGKIIRSHIAGMIQKDRLIQLYIPQIKGTERRKTKPSAAGTLGVEGMDNDLLYGLFLPYAAENTAETRSRAAENPLSKVDFFEDGLTGGPDSSRKRDELAAQVGLPAGMSASALLEALKMLLTYDEYLALVGREADTPDVQDS